MRINSRFASLSNQLRLMDRSTIDVVVVVVVSGSSMRICVYLYMCV